MRVMRMKGEVGQGEYVLDIRTMEIWCGLEIGVLGVLHYTQYGILDQESTSRTTLCSAGVFGCVLGCSMYEQLYSCRLYRDLTLCKEGRYI